MPNIKSAKKRVIINAKKREMNRSEISQVKSAIKKFNSLIETNQIEEAEKMLPEVFSTLDGAVTKGVIHKNNAANKKAALSKTLSDVKNGKRVIVIKKDNKTVAAEKAKKAAEARDAAKAEFQKAAADKKAAKIEAEKAKLAAEVKPVKKAKKADKAEEKKEEVKEEKPKKAKKADKEEPKA